MADIATYLNIIKNAVFGREVRSSIHDGIYAINKEVESTTKSQNVLSQQFKNLVINAGSSNAEVAASRGNYDYLPARLDSVDDIIRNKMDKDGIVSMANMGQDVKEAMTGGSVAVVGNNSVLNTTIVNKQVTPLKTSFISEGKNILDLNSMVAGYLHTDGSLKPGTYKTTTYIPFSNTDEIRLSRLNNIGQNLSMTMRSIRVGCFYDANYNLITDYYYSNSDSTLESVKYKGSQTVAWIRVSILNGFLDGNSMLYKGSEITTFEPYKLKIEGLTMNTSLKNDIQSIINTNGNLYGKTILNFGDSIAAGDGNGGQGYSEILASEYNMNCVDYAVGGATITVKEGSTNNVLNQVTKAISNNIQADIILLEGFTNDISTDTEIGIISDGYNATRNTSTFTGALEEIIYKLKTNYPKAKLCYVIPHKMSSRSTEKQEQFHTRILEVLSKWSVPCVDIYKEGGLNTYLTEHTKLYTNATESQPNGDKTHPNELGYKFHYVPMIISKLKEIL